MTVKELVEILHTFQPDRLVVLSRDEEGTGYSPLADVSPAAYRVQQKMAGEVGVIGLEVLTPELRQKGFSAEDVILNGIPAVVLRPSD